MSEQELARYLELKDIIKENKEEMKPLRKELKELEERLIESGQKEFTYYGMKITIEPKEREKINKDQAEALISEAVHTGKGKFEDYYDVTTVNKVKIEEMSFTSNDTDTNAI